MESAKPYILEKSPVPRDRSRPPILGLPEPDLPYTVDEELIELIACLYGFKAESIASLEYKIDCLRSYRAPDSHPDITTPKQIIEELEFRIDVINMFC